MLKKIVSIKNMAVFKDFEWRKTVRDKGNNVAVFKNINILYGRNYSGKTTLSRIIRAMETNVLSDKYQKPEFNVELDDNTYVTQANPTGHSQVIRVFNEDFVKDNLRFIIDSEEDIKSFAILGDDNNKIEQAIVKIEDELGSEESGTGILGALKRKQDYLILSEKDLEEAQSALDNKLSDKANKPGTGLKHNKIYGDANYNTPKLRSDIEIVTGEDYKPQIDEIDKLKILVKEEAKAVIPPMPSFDLRFQELAKKTKELVEKKIIVSSPIQELLDDAILSEWVRNGRQMHEKKRTTCGFCGSPLPPELWDKLDKHFNLESENLRSEIESQRKLVSSELKRSNSLMTFDCGAFYSEFTDDLFKLKERYDSLLCEYSEGLKLLDVYLNKRLLDIVNPVELINIKDVSDDLNTLYSNYEELSTKSNEYTKSLSTQQAKAKLSLKLLDVYSFIQNINYSAELEKIEELTGKVNVAKADLANIQSKANELQKEIDKLKTLLKDERKGAEKINNYLHDYFGHDSISLSAVEIEQGYRFEVTRNGKKAHHLSEGECSLIAFCYFMAKLEDVDTKDKSPIIWIDDPISSLDVNHIFFVFSLICSQIVNSGMMKQLFISTHNLDFLKYLKRLSGGLNNEKAFFIIERSFSGSAIYVMPDYLKNYVTEFNYLFHQIYKCAIAETSTDVNYECYYNFGNNARKFLEAFLYYKYPRYYKSDDDRVTLFFGDDPTYATLIKRINNEYSHLAGVVERSTIPIDVPEMKNVAKLILYKIKENDEDQYNALLNSIGVDPMNTPLN